MGKRKGGGMLMMVAVCPIVSQWPLQIWVVRVLCRDFGVGLGKAY